MKSNSKFNIGGCLILVIAIIFLIVVGAVLLSRPAAPPYVDPRVREAQTQSQLADIHRSIGDSDFWSGFIKIAAIIVFSMLVAGGGLALFRFFDGWRVAKTERLFTLRFAAPSETGFYPALYMPEQQGYILAESARVIPALPPRTQHNHMHGLLGGTPAGLPAMPDTQSAKSSGFALPPEYVALEDLLRDHPLKPFEIFMGVGANGQPITRPFGAKTLHFGNLGQSGSGKTVFTQSVLTTLARHDPAGSRVRFGFIDPKRAVYKPFQNLPHFDFAATDSEGGMREIERIRKLVGKRMDMSNQERAKEPLLVVAFDEFLSFKRDMERKDFMSLVSLIEQARAAQIWFIFMGHNFYAKGGLEELRAQLATRILFKVEDIGTANAFGFRDNAKTEYLCGMDRPGLYLSKTLNGAEFVQAPFVAEEDIPKLCAPSIEREFFVSPVGSGAEVGRKWAEVPTSIGAEVGQKYPLPSDNTRPATGYEKREKLKRAILAKKSQNEIISELWEVTSGGGRAYQKATEEYRDLLAGLFGDS